MSEPGGQASLRAAAADAPGAGARSVPRPLPRARGHDALAPLRSTDTIRDRCAAVTRAVEDGRSAHFKLDRSRLPALADRVAALTRERFPTLAVPLHSRWRHFEAGGLDRRAELEALLAGRSPADQARARIDLTVVSVLLDAGAGAQWSYDESRMLDGSLAMPVHRHGRDELLALLDQAAKSDAAPATGPGLGGPAEPSAPAVAGTPAAPAAGAAPRLSRSEGLGVATFRAFLAGAFSATRDDPLRADAATLKLVDAATLRAVFQAGPSNPLVGLEGRAGLMSRLGEALQAEAARDGTPARPSLVWDRLTDGGTRTEVAAEAILQELLLTLAPIWTSGSRLFGLRAGDVWPHRWAGGGTGPGRPADLGTAHWVPFHKLSQWLTYSLVEPFEWSGVRVTGLDRLTALPEYRNGGLLLDGGVIVPRQPAWLQRTHKPGDEFVVEWRALTVTLIDELAPLVRQRLGADAAALPLAAILEGGTWAAGRRLAQELRGGAPPVRVDSDGTVF